MVPKWQLKDIIDLEYFLKLDAKASNNAVNTYEKNDANAIHTRDRNIYLNQIKPELKEPIPKTPLLQKTIIYNWLHFRIKTEKKAVDDDIILPGEMFQGIFRLLIFIMISIGFILGSGLAYTFLSYSGKAPLNVAGYLGALVGIQVIIFAIIIIFLILRLLIPKKPHISILQSLIKMLFLKMLKIFKKQTLMSIPANKRNAISASIGLIHQKKEIYSAIAYWPLFILSQLFGIGLNIGILCATLLRVIGTDLAFGWQSTLQFSPNVVFDATRFIATPWSFLCDAPIAHPTIEQVEGSRIILKEGIYQLATENLVSWWPFLCFAVLFYGFIPRLFLWCMGLYAQKKALHRFDFNTPEYVRLVQRLLTPVLTTKGSLHTEENEVISLPEDQRVENLEQKDNPTDKIFDAISAQNETVAFIPEDIYDQYDATRFNTIAQSQLGYKIINHIQWDEEIQNISKLLALTDNPDKYPNILFLQEAWQPPIKEFLMFIRQIRKKVDKTSQIFIFLIGKPTTGTIFTTVKDENFDIWQKKVCQISDPYLRLERMKSNEPQ